MNRSSFSTGFSFNYWDSYDSTIDDAHLNKETAEKMRVKPVHDNLKDEVVGEFLTIEQWQKLVVMKAEKYLNSQSVRKVTAKRAYAGTPTGQHEKGVHLTKKHLIALILYCDFSALCTAFSATFRLQTVFENIESLKLRHSKFAHFGRLLVETVLDFGINGWKHSENPSYQKGPFFCGLNCPLHIGSYAIRLYGPCSTSTKRSVALNFAKSNGVILKLSNDTSDGEEQCFFDCSWISNFFEESERLWIAGLRPLRIVHIVIVRTAKNYQKMIRALYLFDAMISGVDMQFCGLQEKDSDFVLISDLVNETLKGNDSGFNQFDLYLQNEWKLFLQNKKEVILDMSRIDCHFQTLSKVVLFKVVEYEREDIPNGKDNVLKPEWLSMFPSLQTVTINTSFMFCSYKFGLRTFLESLVMMPRALTLIVVDEYGYWAEDALNEDISAEFDAAGWNIKWVQEKKALVIKSKSN